MGAKEKANELVESYLYTDNGLSVLVDEYDGCITLYQAKECALICIDEIIEALDCNQWQNSKIIDFYNEVKQEINKL